MKKILLSILVLSSALLAAAQGKTYYVSPSGNDASNGLSIKGAWKSIDKVNSVVFQPGDKVLFEGGKTFKGQVKLQGSGAEGNPCVISGYGEGRPVINFGRAEGAGILLENVHHWEVLGMEVVSYEPYEIGIGRQGIVVRISQSGTYDHFVIKNNYIHDVWGQLGGNGMYMGYNSSAILVHTQRARIPSTSTAPVVMEPIEINDVLIESNNIERVDKCGIVCRGAKYNVVVRKNYMDNLGGDGIFVNGPYRGLIEFNEIHRSCMRSGSPYLPGDDGWWPHVAACWIQNTEETIMQFNEVYDTGRNLYNGDGFAYDFDFNCKRCIAQYNYSKNNYGLMLLMYNIFENVTRYNISENDHTHLIQMQGPIEGDKSLIYNNVFYIDYGMADLDFFIGNDGEKNPDELGAKFYNNIFYATGQGRFRTAYSSGATEVRKYDETVKPNLPSGTIFRHNCYFGPWNNGYPDDPEALIADPKFVAPGTGGNGLNTLAGYMLRPDSPCINTGIYVPNSGAQDFFGNLLNDGHPDFGAFEQPGSGVFSDGSEAAKDEAARQASSVAWAKWMFPASIASNSPDGPAISLREPLTDDIQGTLTWTMEGLKKPVVVDLSKLKDRQRIALPIKADQAALEATTLKVAISNGNFSEAWEIPFQAVQARRR